MILEDCPDLTELYSILKQFPDASTKTLRDRCRVLDVTRSIRSGPLHSSPSDFIAPFWRASWHDTTHCYCMFLVIVVFLFSYLNTIKLIYYHQLLFPIGRQTQMLIVIQVAVPVSCLFIFWKDVHKYQKYSCKIDGLISITGTLEYTNFILLLERWNVVHVIKASDTLLEPFSKIWKITFHAVE